MTELAALRPATRDDDTFLRSVFADARAEELAQLPLDPSSLATLVEMQYRAQARQYATTCPEAIDHVIVVGGRAVGRCWVHRTASELRVLDIAVLSTARGQGIATAVLRQLHSTGTLVRLSVWQDNTTARRLYASLGFQVRDEDGGYLHLEWPVASKVTQERTLTTHE